MTKIIKECLECGNTFETYYENRFRCSRKCFIIFWKREVRPKVEEKRKEMALKTSERRRTGKNVGCDLCKLVFYKPKKRLQITAHNFCSKRCQDLFRTGKPLSEEWKRKIKENNVKYWLGKKRYPETIEKMRQNTIKQLKSGYMPSKETSIEKIFKEALIKNNTYFETQKPFKLGIEDFYLPFERTFIFCDGNYWHNYPYGKERDKKQVEYLQNEGFKAYRFWESELKKDIGGCLSKIETFKY